MNDEYLFGNIPRYKDAGTGNIVRCSASLANYMMHRNLAMAPLQYHFSGSILLYVIKPGGFQYRRSKQETKLRAGLTPKRLTQHNLGSLGDKIVTI